MKQWSLFLISFGCILIMMSSYMEKPFLLVLTGLCVVIFGFVQVRKGSSKDSKKKRK